MNDNYEQLPVARKSVYTVFVKRLLDISLSLIALICLSPLLAVVALILLIVQGRPIFYATKRPGRNGEIFKLYKFRSMLDLRDEEGWLLPEEKRLTKIGLFIRKASIDELPELLSILKGDMSILGPRPLLVEYLPMYTPRYAARHLVRPGLACVRLPRKDIEQPDTWTWRDQFENDIYYIEHLSFATDVKMLFAVIHEVFKGASYRANDTRVSFDGTNYDETLSKKEKGVISHFDSLN